MLVDFAVESGAHLVGVSFAANCHCATLVCILSHIGEAKIARDIFRESEPAF